jgi:hypothetical protein
MLSAMPRKKSHAPKSAPPPDLGDAFARAMALPTPDYLSLERTAEIINPDETMLIEPDQIGLTNGRSLHPILGTAGFGSCIVLILYDRKTKTAAMTHDNVTEIKSLFKTLREYFPGERKLDLHVLGASYMTSEEDNKYYESYNAEAQELLREFAAEIEGMKDITLKTFDVYSKPKPTAVAIDVRNGQLFAGSDLYRVESTDGYNENVDIWGEWNHAGEDNDFDGTAPEFQR